MNRAPLLVALLLTPLFAVALAPSATAAFDIGAEVEKAWWGTTPSEVDPGEHGRTLTVQLRNVDAVSFKAVQVTLADHPNITPSYDGAETTHLAKTFASGDVWQAAFTVDLDEDLTVGKALDVVLRLSMRAAEDGATWSEGDHHLSSHDVRVPVPGRTELSLRAPTSPLPGQSQVELPLTLANLGTARAGTLEVSFAAPAGSELHVRSPQAPVRIDRLAAQATHEIVPTLLTPTTQGVHELEATVTYANAVGTSTTQTFTLPITVGYPAPDPLETKLLTPLATAGRFNDLVFTVTNTGAGPREDVELTVTPQAATASAASTGASSTTAATLNGTGTVTLGRLAGQQTDRATIPIYLSRQAPDLISLDVDLRWTDPSGFSRISERTFALVVEGAIDLHVTGLAGTFDPEAGTLAVQGTLTNTGNVEATNIYLRVLPSPTVTGTDPLYQGDLDPDAPLPFSLETTSAAGQAPGNAAIVLSWTNDMGQTREIQREVHLREAPASSQPMPEAPDSDGSATPGVGWLAVIGALGLGALVGTIASNRRKGR